MSRRFLHFLIVTCTWMIPCSPFAQNYYPDSSFGIDGFAVATQSTLNVIRTLDIQPDGRFLASGGDGAQLSSSIQYGLFRLKADGQRDSSFGMAGIQNLTVNLNGGVPDYLTTVRTGSTTSVFLRSMYAGSSGTVAARYTSSGTPDPTFGINGRVTVPPYNNFDAPTVALAAPNGKYIIAGTTLTPTSGYQYVATRLKSNGQLDSSFAINGKYQNTYAALSLPCPGALISMSVSSIIPWTQGRFIIGGYYSYGTCVYAPFMVRHQANGLPDSSFASNGLALPLVPIPANNNYYISQLLPDTIHGYIYALIKYLGTTNDLFLMRFDSTGNPDTGYGNNGQASLAIAGWRTDSGYFPFAFLQEDGKMAIAGNVDTGQFARVALFRVTAQGQPDTSLAPNGFLTVGRGTTDFIKTMAVQGDSVYVLGGYTTAAVFDWKPLLLRIRKRPAAVTTSIPGKAEKPIQVFPNPTNGSFQVDNLPPGTMFTLTNSWGQTILSGILTEAQSTLSLPEHSSNGVYLLRLTTPGRAEIRNVPLVLQR